MAQKYECDGPVQESKPDTYSLTYTYQATEDSDVILFSGPNAGWLATEYSDLKRGVTQ